MPVDKARRATIVFPRPEDKALLVDKATALGMSLSEYLWHRGELAEVLGHGRRKNLPDGGGSHMDK